MAISRMQQPQQTQGGLGSLTDPRFDQQAMYNDGGMLEQNRVQDPQRQGYFLGKLVKKAKRAVKKVTKSPLGKMAILGGLGMIPFGASGTSLFGRLGSTGIGGLLKSGAGNLFKKGLTGFNDLSLGKKLFLGAGAASIAAPFFMGGDDDEDEGPVDMQDYAAQVQRARNFYSGQGDGGAGLNFMPQKQYVMSNFYAANGGRAGYAGGMLVEEDDEEEFNRSVAGRSRRLKPAFLNMGGSAGQAQAEQMLMMEYVKYKNKGGNLSFEQFVKAVMQQAAPSGAGMEQPMAMAANGGRIGYRIGGGVLPKVGKMVRSGVSKFKSLFDDADISVQIRDDDVMTDAGLQAQAVGQDVFITPKSNKAVKVMEGLIDEGYDIAKAEDGSYTINALDEGALDLITQRLRIGSKGADEFIDAQDYYFRGDTGMMDEESKMIYNALRNRKAEGGIMETEVSEEVMPLLDMGGKEKDFRETGGFVELGRKERADDVPARLSKNEFVFTADAVRNAGGGDIDKGAEVMENLMNNLEQGGEISEESQGLEGAQAMYDQQQMLQSRIV